MFCLLCHEKISRLRAWRTKSEFCSDEHAEIYKRQTLERLLTDHETTKPAEAPPLPVDHGPASQSESRDGEERTPASEVLARFAEQDARPAVERSLDAESDPESLEHGGGDEGLQELWRLAEEVGPASGETDDDGWSRAAGTLSRDTLRPEPGGFGGLSSLGGLGSGSGGVRQQTAEEALEALRQLSGGRRTSASLEESSDELDTLLSARGLDRGSEDGPHLGATELGEAELAAGELSAGELSPVGESFPGAFDDTLAGEEALSLLDAASLEPLDDDELPSILERLTEHVGEAEEPDLAAGPAAEDWNEEPAPAEAREEPAVAEAAGVVEETGAAEIGAELDQEAAPVEQQTAGEPARSAKKDAGLDLIEEAVESYLEQAAEPASPRGSSRKVLPFPLLRPKPDSRADSGSRRDTGSREDSEAAAPADLEPAASAIASSARSGKPGKGSKAAQGIASDLGRLQLKPVAVMFGLEPTLREPAGDPGEMPAGVGARPALDRIVEPPLSYPDAGGGRRAGAQLPLHARLYPLWPETPQPGPLEAAAGPADWPDYGLPCETPVTLALGRGREPGRPSVGSERAWMFRIEPALAEGPEFEMELPNGNRTAPWQAPWLPPTLVSGVAYANGSGSNGSGKLDLSGPEGRFEPSVDRLCVVFPQPGELGAGIPRQASSQASREELGRWMPPTVLDPRFEIERPAGRDLSDFG